MQPGVEPLRVAETGHITPGPDGGLLDRVARELRVAEDQPGSRVQPREAHVEQGREGVMIASPRPLHETSLVHGRLDFGTAMAVVLDSVWRRRLAEGSSSPSETVRADVRLARPRVPFQALNADMGEGPSTWRIPAGQNLPPAQPGSELGMARLVGEIGG